MLGQVWKQRASDIIGRDRMNRMEKCGVIEKCALAHGWMLVGLSPKLPFFKSKSAPE